MFKLLNSKRGAMSAAAIAAYSFITIFVGAATSATITRHSFREKKAIEKCMSTQIGITEEGCNSAIAGLSREDILDYIKDDDTSENGGYVN